MDQFEVLLDIPWFRHGARDITVIQILAWCVLFMAGAVKRWNWRHVLFMLLVAAVAYLVQWLFALVPVQSYRLAWAIFTGCVSIVLLGVGEMILRKRSSIRQVGWVLAAAIAVVAMVELAIHYTWLEGWIVSLPGRYGMQRSRLCGEIYEPLRALLVWVAIPTCFLVAERSGRWKLAAGGAAIFVLATTMLFVGIVSFPLARKSVLNDGPFDRAASVRWLWGRGSEADFHVMMQAVEENEWRCSGVRGQDWPWPYWREIAIHALVTRDPTGTVERMSVLFRQKPSVYAAEDLAELFAEHERYETVPLLMRYALAEGSWTCSDALEKMRLPIAALPIMRQEMAFGARLEGRRPQKFTRPTRDRLTRLLGQDAGDDVDAWFALYDEVVPAAPTLLPRGIQDDTDRVIATLGRYYAISDEWATTCVQEASRKGLSGQRGMEYVRSSIKTVAEPNWNVLTTTDLEREIEEYEARTRKAINKVRPNG